MLAFIAHEMYLMQGLFSALLRDRNRVTRIAREEGNVLGGSI